MSRLTGFSPLVRLTIKRRAGLDGEYVNCEVCGMVLHHEFAHLHHRIPRGRGGTRRLEVNGVANGLCLCPSDHDGIEANRDKARALGLLISQHRKILPREVPVLLIKGWCLLSDSGDYQTIPEPAGGKVA